MTTRTRSILGIVILALVLIGGIFLLYGNKAGDTADAAVRTSVTSFGDQLQKVSLLAPDVGQEIANAYGPYVFPSLIATWQSDPSKAPGRTTSSPWPARIEVASADKTDADTYTVTGSVILMTSNEVEHGGNAGTIPVSMTLQKTGSAWLITSYTEGTPEAGTSTASSTQGIATSPTTTPSKPVPPVSASLSLSSLSPRSGPVGTVITMQGHGFTPTSQVIIGSGGISNVQVNAAGTVLTFTMPSSMGAYCLPQKPCPMYLLLLQPNTYQLSVRNTDGKETNGLPFTLTGDKNP